MHEKTKLKEARYFHRRMKDCHADRESFIHNLSAFLSAARSVLQYALKEATTKPGGKGWYDGQMHAHRTLNFFKDERDFNIHEEPVAPIQNIGLSITETIRVSASFAIQVIDAQGNVVGESGSAEPQPLSPHRNDPAEVTYSYVFEDWSGPEDVMVLSQLYLDELTAVVDEGINRGFLAP